MLRRSLQKLILDLEAAIQRAEVMAFSSAKPRKQHPATISKTSKQPELDRVVERAAWMRAVLEPRAYETFSQLTADRQFAQLGLVLIGMLAQVETAMAPFVPVEQQTSQPEEKPGSVRAAQGADPSKSVIDNEELDLGVVVSRDELNDGVNVQSSVERSCTPTPQLSSKKTHQDSDRTKSKKRKELKVKGNEANDRLEAFPATSLAPEKRKKLQPGKYISETTEPATSCGESKESRKSKKPRLDQVLSKTKDDGSKIIKRKSTKKKKKGSDEFDDLFSSLL